MTDAGGAQPLLGLSGPRDLSPPQRPLLASQRRFPSSPLQNTSLVTVFEQPVDADRLVAAFSSVVDASDALRTVVTADDRVDFHPVGEHAGTEIVDLGDETVDEWSRRRVRTPVDVRRSVFDSVVLRRNGAVEAWYLSLHHVATDATSSTLVTEAVAAAYAGEAPSLSTYYSRWDTEPSGRRHERAVEHWASRQAADRIGRLYRQTDGSRPESDRVFLPLDADRRARLDAAIEGPYRMLSPDLAWSTLLLAVAGVHIARVSGATTMVLGMPVHNRTDADARTIIGPMMEVFPVDLSIDLDATFADVHASVARSVMETLRHAQTG